VTRPLAAARAIGLNDLTASDTKLEYRGDEHRVRQILVNLVSNAIKFTSSGGTVTITAGVEYEAPPAARVRNSGPWVFARVTDTGIGIPPREHGHVFDAFHQVERGTTRTRGGTGLGLTISRRLARLMHGDVTLESVPGLGSTFTLWLPAASRTGGRATVPAPEATDLRTPGLRELGDLVRRRTPRIVETFVDRVRADPMIPEARRVRGSQLEDHLSSMLMDFAQSLIIVGDAGLDAATLLRDGTAIQRAVGEQHGARRHAQGWRFSALRREQDILREVIAEAVHAEQGRVNAGPGDATAVLFHLIDRSTAISLRAWQRAADEGVSDSGSIVAADAAEPPAPWPSKQPNH